MCVSSPLLTERCSFSVCLLLLTERCPFSVCLPCYLKNNVLSLFSPLLTDYVLSTCVIPSTYRAVFFCVSFTLLKEQCFFLCLPFCLKNGGFSLWLFPAAYRTVSFSVSSSQCCTANVYLSTRQCTHRPSPYKGSGLPVPSANQNITINIPREKAEATFFSQVNPAQHRNERLGHSERKLETK